MNPFLNTPIEYLKGVGLKCDFFLILKSKMNPNSNTPLLFFVKMLLRFPKFRHLGF